MGGGGDSQQIVFAKVPSNSKTIAFRVDSKEILLQAYHQVKTINPFTSVGGILSSVAPKTESPFTKSTMPIRVLWLDATRMKDDSNKRKSLMKDPAPAVIEIIGQDNTRLKELANSVYSFTTLSTSQMNSTVLSVLR